MTQAIDQTTNTMQQTGSNQMADTWREQLVQDLAKRLIEAMENMPDEVKPAYPNRIRCIDKSTARVVAGETVDVLLTGWYSLNEQMACEA